MLTILLRLGTPLSPEKFFVIAICFVIIVILSWYFSKKAKMKRALEKIPLKPISTIIDGEIVKIMGKIEYADSFFFSPLTHRKCAYFQLIVEEGRSSGKHSNWRIIINEESIKPFLINNTDGVVLVMPKTFEGILVNDMHFKSGAFNNASAELERFLTSRGKTSTGLFGFNKTLRYNEGVLEEGETVVVKGVAYWKINPINSLKHKYPRILIIESNQENKVIITDDPDIY